MPRVPANPVSFFTVWNGDANHAYSLHFANLWDLEYKPTKTAVCSSHHLEFPSFIPALPCSPTFTPRHSGDNLQVSSCSQPELFRETRPLF